MNGVHDMGGLQCFGPLAEKHNPQALSDQTLFQHDWEKSVLALNLALGATGTWDLDQTRAARESLPPADYLSIGYYRIWLDALDRLLLAHGLVTPGELQTGRMETPAVSVRRVLHSEDVASVLKKGAPADRSADRKPLFSVGDRVRVRNLHSSTHTRMPAYIRSHGGQVHRIHGVHVFPDSRALGLGEQPQWLYNVRFSATELWGEQQAQAGDVHVDCWEPYLQAGASTDLDQPLHP